MAEVLEAMGFPSDWCEQALRSSGGLEPAVELLLQWQADGGPLPGEPSPPAVSTVTNLLSSVPPGLDAVVPDAGGTAERSHSSNPDLRFTQVLEEESTENQAGKCLLEDEVAASGSKFSENTQVQLQIRCSGYPIIKGTFSAGSTLKEVRNFVLHNLQSQQPAGMFASGGTNRQVRRTSRSNGISPNSSSGRTTQRAVRKTSRYVNSSSNEPAPRAVARGNMYFLIPFPRTVFDTEASMETTLCDANLCPRGILTAQFHTKLGPSTSDHVNNSSETNGPGGEGLLVNPSVEQPSENHRQFEVDVMKRELRLKATLDRYGQEPGRGANGTVVEPGVATSGSILAPPVTPSAIASVGRVREEKRSLELDGERVRHRELALQAAAKRMTAAAQMFREGLMPDAGESGGEGVCCTPSDLPPVHVSRSDDNMRFVSEGLDSKGKQVEDCGPSSRAGQLAELQVHDAMNDLGGFRGRTSRARLRLPSSSPSRPEKMLRTDEGSTTSSAGDNDSLPLFASGHAIARRRGDVPDILASERWTRGSAGGWSSSVSELRIRLEDGSVLRNTFPACTTLQSVCEFAIPGRFSRAEYGLVSTQRMTLKPVLRYFQCQDLTFFEGEALSQTLEEAGLVPRGVVHLQKLASRGVVTQGRHRARRMIQYLDSHNEPEPELEQLWQDFSRHMNTNLSYEELVELEDSIGRVNVGVPEATIANLPTHTVSRNAGDICIVCLSEMVQGEEVMLLPCLHTFHPACIRQWLLQSTCCPTCKYCIT